MFSAEALNEFLSISGVGEAVHVEPLAIEHGVAATAQAQVLTEFMDLLVAAALAKTRRQRDLVRPLAVNGRRRARLASLSVPPSPNGRRVGIRIVTFEACLGFTHVTARRIAQSPKATFVTRLQPCQLPGRAARQLPDQSTTLWVESSSTDDSRLRGVRPILDIGGGPALPKSANHERWSILQERIILPSHRQT